MNTRMRLQMSLMMFFQYFIWGAWFMTMGPYIGGTLSFTGEQIGLAYSSTAIAAMISPFFVGMVADRFFSTQKILAVLHILGGVTLFFAGQAKTFGTFFPLLIAHTLCYMPTLALTNSIAFKQMKDPGKEFPSIRVLGTIAWICAGFAVNVPAIHATTSPMPFTLAAAVSIIMGLYCLSLPHTPPTATGKVTARDVLGLDALALMKEPSFAIFVLCSFLICIPLTFYFTFTGIFLSDMNVSDIPRTMTYGQMSEIFFMLVMPFFFARLGVKWMLFVGMLAWGARYFLFVMGYNSALLWPLLLGITLHGICYDFFFVTAYIYVDKKAAENIRAKAQGFIAFILLGLGMFVGSNLSGKVASHYSFPNVVPAKFQTVQDTSVWAENNFVKWDINGVPAYGKIVTIFKDGPLPDVTDAITATAENPAARIQVWKKVDGQPFKESTEFAGVSLKSLSKPLPLYDKIWMIPAVGALLVMVLFALLFRHKEEPSPEAARK